MEDLRKLLCQLFNSFIFKEIVGLEQDGSFAEQWKTGGVYTVESRFKPVKSSAKDASDPIHLRKREGVLTVP